MPRLQDLAGCDLGEAALILSLAFHGSPSLAPAWQREVERDRALGRLKASDSVAAHVGSSMIGVTLVASCKDEGFRISAAGVRPGYRRQGIARSMTCRVIERARAARCRGLWLEVGSENQGAVRLWTGLGFEVTRRLLDLRAARPDFRLPVDWGTDRCVHPAPVRDLLEDFDRLHAVSTSRTRSASRLASLAEELRGVELIEEGRRVGYLIRRGPRVEDVGVLPGRKGALVRLLEAAFRHEKVLHFTSWPENDPLIVELQRYGFVRLASSFEMKLTLPLPAPE